MSKRETTVPIALHSIKPGQTAEFFARIADIQEKTTRRGDPYFRVELCDMKKQLPANIWFNSPYFELFRRNYKVGQFLYLRATYAVDFPNLEVLEAREITDADYNLGFDPADFERSTVFNIDEMFAELLSFVKKIENKSLQRLVKLLLDKHGEQFKRHPAASRNHHAYRGGLLEHTLSVVRTGEYLAEKYRLYYADIKPKLNKDLILAGCILHDIGKLVELEANPASIDYTKVGVLVGHVIVGRDMVRDAAREIDDFDPEVLLLLEHIILSHQYAKEWDSPKEPAFPEALLVHFADDMDAKMNMYVSVLEGTADGATFSDQNNIFRRKMLKERSM